MNQFQRLKNSSPLFLGMLFTIVVMILGCSPKSSSQTSKSDAKESTKYLLTVQDPFSSNLEWATYREFVGMYALHLKPSVNLLEKQYEIKEEVFMDSTKIGELIFKADKLGFIRNALYKDSCMHFYSFRDGDSSYSFQYNPKQFNTFGIHLPLERKNNLIYKWVELCEGAQKTFELKDSTWKPIFTLTLPYKELCTPNECFYCVLPENVNHYQDWGKTMKIKHYYIFSIRFL